MPRPGNIPNGDREYLTLSGMPWLNDAVGQGFVRGGIYIASGTAGVGKSTLMQQALGDFAQQQIKVLYMTNEQSLGELDTNIKRLFAGRTGKLPPGIAENFHLEDRVRDVDELPRFLNRYVLPRYQEYHGTQYNAAEKG